MYLAAMDVDLSSIFKLRILSPGRRLFAMRQVKKLAHEMGFSELEAHAEASLAHDKKTRELDARWAATGTTPVKPGQVSAQQIDLQIDSVLTAIRDVATAQARGLDPHDPLVAKVDEFLSAILPAGLQAVTSLPYVEELAAVDGIVDKMKGDLADHVTELGLGRLSTRLADLAVDYRNALESPQVEKLTFGTVRAARAQGQQNVLEAMALIVGRHRTNGEADVKARAKLLEPILKQDEAVAAYTRARRAIEDVNPETGEVDPEAPPSVPQI